MTESEVLNRIKYFLDFNHWSLYRLAKESGLPYSSLNNLFNRNTCPTIATLEKICNGFNISMSEFFNQENNPLRNHDLTIEQQNLINSYEALSCTDKQLLQVYLNGLLKR